MGRRFFVTGALVLIAGGLVYTGVSIAVYGARNELVKADAAVVLGAAVREDAPSPVFQARIDHGIWLYQKGWVAKIIFTGGRSAGARYADSVIARRYAHKKGVPRADMFVETQSRITEENLYYSKKVAEKNGLKTFIVVSDPLHMKRAMLMARDYGLKAFSSPTPTTRYRTWPSQLQFLARETYFYIQYRINRWFKKARF